MTDQDWQHAVSFTEAARRLDTSFERVFDDIVSRRLRVVFKPNARPLVPLEAIDERLRERADSGA